MSTALTFPRLLAIGALLLALQWLTENPAPLLPGWPLLMVSIGALLVAPLGLEVLRRNRLATITVPPAAWLIAWLGLTSSLVGAPGWVLLAWTLFSETLLFAWFFHRPAVAAVGTPAMTAVLFLVWRRGVVRTPSGTQ